MPLTPYHWGPLSAIGLVMFRFLDIPALLVSGVILDVEPFLLMVLGSHRPLHSVTHNVLVGTVIALATALVMYRIRLWTGWVMNYFGLRQASTLATVVWTSLLGVYSHILLDAPLYADVQPFWPLRGNVFYGGVSSGRVYAGCAIMFLAAGGIYLGRMILPGICPRGPAR